VHTAAKIVCDARFARIVQEAAVDHAEREAAGCDDNQLRQDTPHAVSHGLIGVLGLLLYNFGLRNTDNHIS
jgi:hypothetical protein